MGRIEHERLHALHYFQKRKQSILEHEQRVRERNKREQERKQKKARKQRDIERRKKLLLDCLKELEEKKKMLAGGVFFTYPGAALLFDTEAEARKSGGDQVRRFDTVADAVSYARGEQDAERRENTEKRTEQDGKQEQGTACPE